LICERKLKISNFINIVITIFFEANESNIYIYPRGLDERFDYEIAGATRTGRVWMCGGFLIPRIKEEYESFRFEIKRV